MARLALRQFLAQDYPSRELVVIDEPDEETASFCDGLVNGLYDGASTLYVQEAGTLGHKLNIGADCANGQILLNWDDDDFYSTDRITRQVEALRLGGRPAAGLSSLIYWSPGSGYGWEYFADAYYCSGGTHCRWRDYQLQYPHPDRTCGEDDEWIADVYARSEISTISGMRVYVARNHNDHVSPRFKFEQSDFWQRFGVPDNFRRVALAEFEPIVSMWASSLSVERRASICECRETCAANNSK